jgi:hypothetical protein
MLTVPIHMRMLRNRTVYAHTLDQQSGVEYVLDSIGFRNPIEFSHNIAVLGNTVSFGAGVNNSLTFASKLNAYNASYCWYRYMNHDQLGNIKFLAERCETLIIQINSLGRRRIDDELVIKVDEDKSWAVRTFLDYFDQVKEITKNNRVLFLYWDKVFDHPIPKNITDQFLINNKLYLDSAHPSFPQIMGPKSHRAVAQVIDHALNGQ